MTPAARLQATIEVLSMVNNSKKTAQQALQHWGNTHRFAGSGDRRAIADTVYEILRHYFLYAEAMEDTHPRALVLAWLHFTKKVPLDEIEQIFCGAAYQPSPMRDGERAALQRGMPRTVSFAARCNMPPELEPLLAGCSQSEADLTALNTRAPFDLRVNLLKTTREHAYAALSKKHKLQPTACAPTGLRFAEPISLQDEPLYKNGSVEVQDEASQLTALLVQAQPDHAVLDYCAGGGGKTLALAAFMRNKGTIVASDIAQERLKNLRQRAERAGATNIRVAHSSTLSPEKKLFDRVVVDAPCSGSGTRRRNPEAMLQLTAQQVDNYAHNQRKILQQAAPFTAVGGRLVYITCSLFATENTAVAEHFLTQNPNFSVVPARDVWQQQLPKIAAPASVEQYAHLRTVDLHADSFFVAIFERTAV